MKFVLKAMMFLEAMLPISAVAETVVLGNGESFVGDAETVDSFSTQCPGGGIFHPNLFTCTTYYLHKDFKFTIKETSEVTLQANSTLYLSMHRDFDEVPGADRVYLPNTPKGTLEDGTKTYSYLLSPGTYVGEFNASWSEGSCCSGVRPPLSVAISAGWSPIGAEDPRNPGKVLVTFTDDYWKSGSVAEVAEAPFLAATAGNLHLEVPLNDSLPRFGYLETRESLAPLPPGGYIINFRTFSGGTTMRLRVSTEDGLYQSMASVAKGRYAPASKDPLHPDESGGSHVELMWRSDGVTPWRIAVDQLAFMPGEYGKILVSDITAVPVD